VAEEELPTVSYEIGQASDPAEVPYKWGAQSQTAIHKSNATGHKISRKKVARAKVSSTVGNIQGHTTSTKGQCIIHYKYARFIDQTMSNY
jgi:hypothetical protein